MLISILIECAEYIIKKIIYLYNSELYCNNLSLYNKEDEEKVVNYLNYQLMLKDTKDVKEQYRIITNHVNINMPLWLQKNSINIDNNEIEYDIKENIEEDYEQLNEENLQIFLDNITKKIEKVKILSNMDIEKRILETKNLDGKKIPFKLNKENLNNIIFIIKEINNDGISEREWTFSVEDNEVLKKYKTILKKIKEDELHKLKVKNKEIIKLKLEIKYVK